jgi:hypothetical protein
MVCGVPAGEELEMDLLKEALEPRWVTVQVTPAASVRAVSLEDTVGLKARAWHDRFVIRDIIDLRAVAGTFSYADPENLARRHDPDLDLEAMLDQLAGHSARSADAAGVLAAHPAGSSAPAPAITSPARVSPVTSQPL